MCGIAGIVDRQGSRPPRREELARMIACVEHRGPDGFGLRLNNDSALRADYLELAPTSGVWPCEYPAAQYIQLRVPTAAPAPPVPPPLPSKPGVYVAEADLQLGELQDLADVAGALISTAAGCGVTFHVRVELGGENPPTKQVVDEANKILSETVSKMHFENKS